MLKFNFASEYLKRLEERIAKWSGADSQLGVVLYAPPEIMYWHWLEYGTREGRGPYLITPTGGRTQLVFVQNGILHFEGQVLHPGIRPRRFVATSLPEIRELYGEKVKLVFEDPNELQRFLISVGEKAKEILTENLAAVTKSAVDKLDDHPFGEEFPNQQGRLKGRSASDVFNEKLEIRKIE